MKHTFRLAAALTAVALLASPALAEPKHPTPVTITGTVSATPAVGATEVAVAVKTAPAADKKIVAGGIKGTVIIVTLASGVTVKRDGNAASIGDLRTGDKVTITLASRTGASAPYKYVASRFIANSVDTNFLLNLAGVVAVAPAESATSIMVFVKSYSSSKFYPVNSLKNTTIQVALATGGVVTRNGTVSSLAGLKLDDRITATITQRTGTTAPYTYIASRIIATAANTDQAVTVTGSITATPGVGATSVSVYVKNVSNDVGWANDALKGTVITVGLAAGGTVTRNGDVSTLAALHLDDRVTLTITSRTGAAAPYLYLASKVVATPFASRPFTVSGTLVSIPEVGATRVVIYVKSVVENDDHNAYANDLKGHAILVSMATGGTVIRNGLTSTLAALVFNDQVSVTIADRTGAVEPYTYLASRLTANS